MTVGDTTGVTSPVGTVSSSAGVSVLTWVACDDDIGAVVVAQGGMRSEADVPRERNPSASPR